jgi:hypothetical protein
MKNNKYDYDELLQMAFNVVKEAEANAAMNPTNEKIQVVIVEPFKTPYKKTIPNTLDAMKEIVGGYIENVFIGRTEKGARIGAVVNEEGKMINLPVNKKIMGRNGAADIFVGTFFITAYNLQGEGISLTDEQCETFIKRFTGFEVYL